MKDIYSKEERNKILNMAMKQYECCGVSLELGDYFVVEEYPTMIFKIDNEWDKKLRLFYTIITEKSFMMIIAMNLTGLRFQMNVLKIL